MNGFEQLQCHFLGQATLMQLQLRSHNDHGSTRVIHALPKQVLTESALLPLQRVGQRLQGSIIGSTQNAAAAAVIEQGINRLLQHPLFVSNDDIGCMQLDQLLQPIVAVDDTAVQIVQIRCREPAAIEGNKGTQLRGNDRNYVQNHPLRLVA